MNRSTFLKAGTLGVTDEDALKQIVTVNAISLIVGVSILVIGTIICYFLHWDQSVIIALSIDFIGNAMVFLLNARGRHQAAKYLLYYLQYGIITYFGYKLSWLRLEFIIVLQIALLYLIFKDRLSRLIAIASVFVELGLLEVSYYNGGKVVQTIMPYDVSFTIQLLVVLAIMGITIVISQPFVKSNDDNPALKKANQFIKIFVAQVTHELRTPLDNIHQVTQLMKKEAEKHESLKQIQPLSDILLTASSDARNIVNNVLDMAEIEAGKTPATVNSAFRVRPFFEKLLEVYRIVAREEDMRIQLLVDMPEVIISDVLNINQVLTNLLANAIKFGFKDHTIVVEVKRDDPSWIIKVSNVGAGIPEEKLKAIFDPFVTGRTGLTQGTGLGLYIVKKKLEAMNGRIRVDSKRGGYTTFTVTLPLIEGRLRDVAETERPGQNAGTNLGNVHVLLAEDSKLTSFLMFRFLKDMGCKVTMASNGRELLEAAQQSYPGNTPDIIILDCHMPVLDGEQTIRQLKKMPGLSHIPIIVTTGDLYSNMVDKMLEAGADTYLKKPIDHTALQKTISQYLTKPA